MHFQDISVQYNEHNRKYYTDILIPKKIIDFAFMLPKVICVKTVGFSYYVSTLRYTFKDTSSYENNSWASDNSSNCSKHRFLYFSVVCTKFSIHYNFLDHICLEIRIPKLNFFYPLGKYVICCKFGYKALERQLDLGPLYMVYKRKQHEINYRHCDRSLDNTSKLFGNCFTTKLSNKGEWNKLVTMGQFSSTDSRIETEHFVCRVKYSELMGKFAWIYHAEIYIIEMCSIQIRLDVQGRDITVGMNSS